jgi:hypothetical protein
MLCNSGEVILQKNKASQSNARLFAFLQLLRVFQALCERGRLFYESARQPI